MKIGVIGHNYTHGADFVMNYPKGPGCYLFLLVKSPARFLLNGKKLRLEKNTILFFTPHTACRYAAENGTYTDDWFYCNMRKNLPCETRACPLTRRCRRRTRQSCQN